MLDFHAGLAAVASGSGPLARRSLYAESSEESLSDSLSQSRNARKRIPNRRPPLPPQSRSQLDKSEMVQFYEMPAPTTAEEITVDTASFAGSGSDCETEVRDSFQLNSHLIIQTESHRSPFAEIDIDLNKCIRSSEECQDTSSDIQAEKNVLVVSQRKQRHVKLERSIKNKKNQQYDMGLKEKLASCELRLEEKVRALDHATNINHELERELGDAISHNKFLQQSLKEQTKSNRVCQDEELEQEVGESRSTHEKKIAVLEKELQCKELLIKALREEKDEAEKNSKRVNLLQNENDRLLGELDEIHLKYCNLLSEFKEAKTASRHIESEIESRRHELKETKIQLEQVQKNFDEYVSERQREKLSWHVQEKRTKFFGSPKAHGDSDQQYHNQVIALKIQVAEYQAILDRFGLDYIQSKKTGYMSCNITPDALPKSSIVSPLSTDRKQCLSVRPPFENPLLTASAVMSRCAVTNTRSPMPSNGKDDGINRCLSLSPLPSNPVSRKNSRSSQPVSSSPSARSSSAGAGALHRRSTELSFTFRERVVRLYRHYRPGKVKYVDQILRQYGIYPDSVNNSVEKERKLMDELVRKYGPEPDELDSESMQEMSQRGENAVETAQEYFVDDAHVSPALASSHSKYASLSPEYLPDRNQKSSSRERVSYHF